MRYPQFRAKGLCVSSGVVEAGCKQIGDRLKRAGMRWTVAGPTPSSPCAAASSADASRTSGSDVPQVPPDAAVDLLLPQRAAAGGRVAPARRQSAGVIVTILGLMIRSMIKQFEQTNRRIDDVRTDLKERLNDTNRRIDDTRTELNTRLDETNRHIEETNRRLERVETRVDQIGRDIGELRDRTGKLEGTVSTFISSQDKSEAA